MVGGGELEADFVVGNFFGVEGDFGLAEAGRGRGLGAVVEAGGLVAAADGGIDPGVVGERIFGGDLRLKCRPAFRGLGRPDKGLRRGVEDRQEIGDGRLEGRGGDEVVELVVVGAVFPLQAGAGGEGEARADAGDALGEAGPDVVVLLDEGVDRAVADECRVVCRVGGGVGAAVGEPFLAVAEDAGGDVETLGSMAQLKLGLVGAVLVAGELAAAAVKVAAIVEPGGLVEALGRNQQGNAGAVVDAPVGI